VTIGLDAEGDKLAFRYAGTEVPAPH
jgi:hypothetical protein